jgi:hypothetical protein
VVSGTEVVVVVGRDIAGVAVVTGIVVVAVVV